MEEKEPLKQIPTKRKKRSLGVLLFICGIIILFVGIGGYFIGTTQNVPKSQPTPTAVQPIQQVLSPTSVPTNAPAGDSFTQFVQLFGEIVPILTSSQFEQLAMLQPQTTATCDDQAPYNPTICQGQPNGTHVSGYVIGYEASEGSIYSREQFIQTLTNYVNDHGPFIYGSNTMNGNTASITLYNATRDWKLAVVLKNDNPEHLWQIQYTLLGVNLE